MARKADHIAEDLMAGILEGDVPVGSILPREADLARRYRVGRSAVREALKLLEVHRLVRPVRRRGTEVLDPLRSLSPEVLRALIVRRSGRIDHKGLAGFLEIRALLDTEMACAAARNRTADDLRALDASVAEVRANLAAGADPDEHVRLTNRWAALLARATGNPLFVMLEAWHEMVMDLLPELFRATRPATQAHGEAIALINDMIRSRNERAVREALDVYHAWATPQLLDAAKKTKGRKKSR